MRTAFFLPRHTTSLCLLAMAAAGPALGADHTATAYQVTPAHNALVRFSGSWGPNLSVAWTAALDGSPSFPLVVGTSVFAVIGGSPVEIVRIDATSGKTLWKASAGSGNSVGLAYDQGRLFSVNSGGLMTAYKANSGKQVWSVQLPGQYSFSAAPSALNGVVYTGGAGEGGTLYAVDGATGKVIWTQPVENGDDSSPSVTASGVYVTYPCQYYDFTPSSGAPIWHVSTGCDGGGGATPVTYNNMVFVRDYPSNTILNAQTGAVIGSFPGNSPPAIAGHVGYFLDNETLSAIDPATSKLFWEFSGDGSIATPPLVVNGYVMVASGQGHLYVVDAAKGTAAATIKLPGAAIGPLGAGDKLVLVPVGNTLVAYGSAP